jgi:hypothetical protein
VGITVAVSALEDPAPTAVVNNLVVDAGFAESLGADLWQVPDITLHKPA